MTKRLPLLAVPLLTLLVVLHGSVAPAKATGGTSVIVSYIYDGDTLALRNGRRVRLLQIDSPELRREGRPELGREGMASECYAAVARGELQHLVPLGSRVRLEVDGSLDRVDRYGHLLRYVHYKGLNVNLALVRRGAAAPYFYRGDRGRYADALMSNVRKARAGWRGLWGACPKTKLDPSQAVETRP